MAGTPMGWLLILLPLTAKTMGWPSLVFPHTQSTRSGCPSEVGHSLYAHHADGVVEGEHVGVGHGDGHAGTGGSRLYRPAQFGLDGSCAHAVVLHLERVALLRRGETANLVDGRGHRSDFGDACVDVGLVHVGVAVLPSEGLCGDAFGVGGIGGCGSCCGEILRGALVEFVAALCHTGIGKRRCCGHEDARVGAQGERGSVEQPLRCPT